MKELAEQALDVATGLGASYCDVRIIDSEAQFIETKNLRVSAVNFGSSLGAGIRVLYNGGWGFASTQDLSRQGIEQAIKRAVAVAKASSQVMEKPIVLAPEPVHVDTWSSPCKQDPFTISLEQKLAVLLDAAKIITSVKGVTLATGSMAFIKDKKFFASTEGSRIEQNFVRSSCGVVANATDDHDRQRRSYPSSFGGQWELAGWEMVGKWDLPGHAQQTAEEAVALLTAPVCPQGTKDLILGSSQLALQIHESTGHPTELDRALGQEINYAGASFLTPDKLGKLKYGSPMVNLVADATTKGSLGSFGYDDEGVQAQCVDLVKDGIFTGYLSSRDTAELIGLKRSGGCMRSESWNRTPIIRMTTISLLPGDSGELDNIISDTKDGIYMETNKSWSIDQLRYNFQFSTEIGWEIKDGKRGRMFKNPSYGGITPEFWNSCDAIAGESEFITWGVPNCGKGQPSQTMWTGHGAAPARFRNVKVGIATKV
ncbi:MAG: TldD/PmbA family protein [Candidatus Obscuribacterales bacterium]|nr:TldD/PmbA family protein [Candidatus Obscuribacterales bacterium]